MICPNCDGKGVVHVRNIHAICGKCKGFGWINEPQKKPQTNEEWLRSLNTEQLAEWFENNGFLTCPLRDCYDCEYYDKKNDDCDDVTDHKHMWVEWLKQPHQKE